jgi:alkanesulfonate monooxygenase SsuD/methylene tetrahydromethanopterin reductase-like flavin-dependent oxidoreductase (luciferase family)
MKFTLFYLPNLGPKKLIEKGMAGKNTQAYQNMLYQIKEQVKAADELGYHAIAFTEHHFHIEGFEISNNPIMLGLYFSQHTKNIKIAQLANVLPFQNPLRLAEDLAMLDQMTKGRVIAGFARGYQKRWADVLGQVYGVEGTLSDKSAVDARNQALFMEHYNILKKAWTEDTFTYHGDNWQIPPQKLEFNHSAVSDYGTGLGEDGLIKEIGIAPKTYQQPHPPIWQPFSFSESTFRFCARENIVPFALTTDDDTLQGLLRAYQEEAAAHGHHYELGQNIGVLRDVFVAETDEEAKFHARNGNGFVWPKWFGPIGFDHALKRPHEDKPGPGDFDDLYERGFEIVGNPDTVNFMIEKLVKNHNIEHLLMWQYPGLIPHDKMMRHIEMFATDVMPNWY